MKNLNLLVGLLAIVILSSCASAKQDRWLGEHDDVLRMAMQKDATKSQKIDAVASSFTNAMNQSLNHLNPKKGVQYLEKYTQQNEGTIDKLLGEVKESSKGMSTMETVAMGLSIVQKPYFGDFLNLFPRLINKFQTINSIMRLGGKVKNGLIGLGADKLGNLGGDMLMKNKGEEEEE